MTSSSSILPCPRHDQPSGDAGGQCFAGTNGSDDARFLFHGSVPLDDGSGDLAARAGGIEVEYDFIRLICSKFDSNDPSHAMVRQIMEQTFGPALLPVPILESAEISHAALRMMTVYELERPIGTPRTHKRCRANLDEALGQVEAMVRRGWGIAAPASEEAVVNG